MTEVLGQKRVNLGYSREPLVYPENFRRLPADRTGPKRLPLWPCVPFELFAAILVWRRKLTYF
jgi:hypothetical protein